MTNRLAVLAAAALSILCASHDALAAKVECAVNPRTDAHTCVDVRQLQEKDGLRSAPMFSGGPNGVRRTGFSVVTNCKTGVTHLKDRDGVSFAGGYGNETSVLRTLRGVMCEAPVPARKKR